MAGKSSMMMIVLLIAVVGIIGSSSMALIGGAAMYPSLMGNTTTINGTGPPLDVTFENIKRAGDGCVVLYEKPDGTGANQEFCLDGRDKYTVNNLKSYDFNDKAMAMDVGQGVSARLYGDADKKGAYYNKTSPGWVNFADENVSLTLHGKHLSDVSSLQLTKN